MATEFWFAWEGASHPDGPWQHLRVVALRVAEAMSRPGLTEVELVRRPEGADVDVDAMIGACASLRIRTGTMKQSGMRWGMDGGRHDPAVGSGATP